MESEGSGELTRRRAASGVRWGGLEEAGGGVEARDESAMAGLVYEVLMLLCTIL